jgi:hypothetical protein
VERKKVSKKVTAANLAKKRFAGAFILSSKMQAAIPTPPFPRLGNFAKPERFSA